jgi:hypothetical protein
MFFIEAELKNIYTPSGPQYRCFGKLIPACGAEGVLNNHIVLNLKYNLSMFGSLLA